MAEYLNIRPRVVDTTGVGGSSYEFHAAHAARALAAGKARVALLTYGSTARSDSRAIGTGGPRGSAPTPSANMETPYGLTLVGNYALVARRHMHQYGTTPEQLAEIAVVTRAHAMRSPEAVRGLGDIGQKDVRELTVEDVLGSRMIADPLHLFECCIISDGGGAVVIVAPEVARDVRTKPVWIIGTGESAGFAENGGDITVSAAARSGPEALGEAGVRPDEIDIAMIYDSFTITVLTILEDLGFCAQGEGARLAVAHGNGGQLGTRHAAGTIVLAREG
jgi:acetyl-CoA C-acetyltransferase